jgi:hypothetical protein
MKYMIMRFKHCFFSFTNSFVYRTPIVDSEGLDFVLRTDQIGLMQCVAYYMCLNISYVLVGDNFFKIIIFSCYNVKYVC